MDTSRLERDGQNQRYHAETTPQYSAVGRTGLGGRSGRAATAASSSSATGTSALASSIQPFRIPDKSVQSFVGAFIVVDDTNTTLATSVVIEEPHRFLIVLFQERHRKYAPRGTVVCRSEPRVKPVNGHVRIVGGDAR